MMTISDSLCLFIMSLSTCICSVKLIYMHVAIQIQKCNTDLITADHMKEKYTDTLLSGKKLSLHNKQELGL